MGSKKGFLEYERSTAKYRSICERVKDYKCVACQRGENEDIEQSSRCMDCGTPFCNWGCPVGNYIPEWNDAVFGRNWKRAYELLSATNPLPEVTGRICPNPCEYACVLGINDDPVTIRDNEVAIIEYAFKKGWVKPRPPKKRTGKKVAIIGSGPAGLSAASELNRYGHTAVVFERYDKPGGIMRYGIPDFKLEKKILDRRIDIMRKEGIEFRTNTNVGSDYPVGKLRKGFDAVLLAGGSRVPRDIKIEGRELGGIYFAMDYLIQSNLIVAKEVIPQEDRIDAKGKKVVVIGGGDTGADCVGTANRQGAKCVVQIEVLPKPSEDRPVDQPWPLYPMILKTSSSHEEGAQRDWSILTKSFIGENGIVKKISCIKVEFEGGKMKEIAGSEFEIGADLVILAVGFLHPEHHGLLDELGLDYDERGNVKTDGNYMTSKKKIFSSGDMHRGQSLIVWAIYEGREAARSIHDFLS